MIEIATEFVIKTALKMVGMSGGSMLRTRRRDANVKPNRRLDRKSSRGMLYENEELRLRTININAEVERGQSDIKKLKRENDQLRREVGALRGEYDRLERLLHQRQDSPEPETHENEEDKISVISCCSDCSMDCCENQNCGCSDVLTSDSQNVTIKCPRYPACHSLETVDNRTSKDIRECTACHSDGGKIKPNEKNEGTKNISTCCQNCLSNKNEKQNKFNFDFINNNNPNIQRMSGGAAVASCQNETNENDANKRQSEETKNDYESQNDIDEDSPVVESCLRFPNLDLSMARCCGTLLSPVPEEGAVPLSPTWNNEVEQICSCQPNNIEEQNTGSENMDISGPGPERDTENKEYYKAVVTVPLSSHIPVENTIENNATQSTSNIDSEMPIFPKSGLDILINNNCYDKFEGFTNVQPLGFIVPPPLNPDSWTSNEPYQIVPNVEFYQETNFTPTNSTNLIYTNVPSISTICSSSLNKNNPTMVSGSNNMENDPFSILNLSPGEGHNDPFIFTERGNIYSTPFTTNDLFTNSCSTIGTTSFQQIPNGSIVTAAKRIIEENDQQQNHTFVTTTESIFMSNPVTTSNELSLNINPSISPTIDNDILINNNELIANNYFSSLVPFNQENNTNNFTNPNFNNNNSVSDTGSSVSDNGMFQDSYFLCKTRKVIQQLTTIHDNSDIGKSANPCGCTCKCNQQIISNPSQEVTSEIFSSVDDKNCKNTRFRTEKCIELNYDYPKPIGQTVSQENIDDSLLNNDKVDEDVNVSKGSTQTIQTTTEVNSTLVLFERKKFPFKMKSRRPDFERSNSAPVEIPSDEPIYATVNKLPKKLKRLHIRNLENEIRYVPPEEIKENEDKKVKADEDNKGKDKEKERVQSNGQTVDDESKDKVDKKINGIVKKDATKSDSFSESSEKNVDFQKKSPGTVRKKKKFSIRFKRKCSKISNNSKISGNDKSDDVNNDEKNCSKISSEKLTLDLSKACDSDKLLVNTPSSPETPEERGKDLQRYCKKHGKLKHHHHFKEGCESPRCYREDYPHHRCNSHKHSSGNHSDSGVKKHNVQRSYYKQDSYQEMTTSHSERERTNSLSSSGHSAVSLGSKARSGSHSRREGSIPWCGCWGNSCL